MAMVTSSAAVGSAAAHCQTPAQMHESFPLKCSPHSVSPPTSSSCRSTALSSRTSMLSFPWPSKSVSSIRAVSMALETSKDAAATSTDVAAGKVTKYHFLVANAKFMLDDEEHFQELMRERLRLFAERKREQDFWLVIEPQFLEKFPHITERLGRPAVALVSTDELWITFMKLRLDKVLRGEIEGERLTEILKSNPVELSFEKPQIWTAPYSKYEGPWWTSFLPPAAED